MREAQADLRRTMHSSMSFSAMTGAPPTLGDESSVGTHAAMSPVAMNYAAPSASGSATLDTDVGALMSRHRHLAARRKKEVRLFAWNVSSQLNVTRDAV
jgi:hypothetical protein